MQAPRLRYWRELRFLTQDQLAARAGVTSATISRLEQGHPARMASILKLAAALDVAPQALVQEPLETVRADVWPLRAARR